MKLDKLLKRLKRDAAASPQKAGALGLMVVVALYFWWPLIMKGGKAKPKPGAPAAVTQVILGDDPVLVKAAVHPANNSLHWDRVREAMARDRLMVAAMPVAEMRNPFTPLVAIENTSTAKTGPEVTKPEPTKTLPAAPAADVELAKQRLAGVTLSSVLIGKRGPSAVIRGKVYRVGDVLSFGGDNGEPVVEFRIVAIDEQGVDLKFDEQDYRLQRPKPALSSGELQRE